MMYFGAKTVNNLPLMMELAHPGSSSGVTITYKVPVIPLKPLFEGAINFIFKR